MFRKQMALEWDLSSRRSASRTAGSSNPNQYSILLKGEEVARGDILTDHYLALAPGDESDDISGIETVDPAFHIPAKWISEDKNPGELAGYTDRSDIGDNHPSFGNHKGTSS